MDASEYYSPVWSGRVGVRVLIFERIYVMSGCELFADILRDVKQKSIGILTEALVRKPDVLIGLAVQEDGHLFDTVTDTIKVTENLSAFNGKRTVSHRPEFS